MKIVILDRATLGFDIDMSIFEALGEVKSYDITKANETIDRVKNADIVLINLPQFEGFIPAILGKMFGKKVISIYHCEIVLPSGMINRLIESLLHIVNSLTLFLSNRIITYTFILNKINRYSI